jgi:hypothetical protein
MKKLFALGLLALLLGYSHTALAQKKALNGDCWINDETGHLVPRENFTPQNNSNSSTNSTQNSSTNATINSTQTTSTSPSSQQTTTSANFYADPNRGNAHEVAFFYDGPDGQNFSIDFGDGNSGAMTPFPRTDCFPYADGTPRVCPNYSADHIYSSSGTYTESLKDSSGKILYTITTSVK